MLSKDAGTDAFAMVRELEELRVTRVIVVPVLLAVLLEVIARVKPTLALKLVVVSGDVLEVSLLQQFQ